MTLPPLHRIPCTIAAMGFLLVGTWKGLADDAAPSPLAKSLPRIAPQEPDQAIKSFDVLAGFRLELAAHEPLVVDPVHAAFDEDGKLWVVEMRGYPYPEEGPKIGRVTILSDADDDGRFDRSAVLADGLPWPTGIALWKGGCFVIAAPDLWYFKDTNGDGVADTKERVWTGFEKSNVQALANNLKWGLDGRIYGVSALNGGNLTRVDQPQLPPVSIRGRDFAFDPQTRTLETVTGTMQFGQSFDDWYDRFLCGNSNHAMHVVLDQKYVERSASTRSPRAVVDIPADGAAGPVFRKSNPEPWRVVRTARRAASGQSFSTAELHATGYFTSASGVTIYRGDAYPPAYHGNLFVGDVGGNLIHRKLVEPSSATFIARRADENAEFVTSRDNWFRPVNFVNGPDGCLYVLDMYRETIEHPWSIPEDIKSLLDLESGRDRGRVYRLVPPDFQRRRTPALSKASVEECVEALGHTNAWHRETAQRLLLERRDPSTVELLRKHLWDQDPAGARATLHRMATLAALDELQPEEIARGLAHAEPRLREQSVRWAESRLGQYPALGPALLAMTNDSAFRVRWQVALSIGSLPVGDRTTPLLTLAQKDRDDPWMTWAIVTSASDAPGLLLSAMLQEHVDRPALVDDLIGVIALRRPKEMETLWLALQPLPESDQRRMLAALGRTLGWDKSQPIVQAVPPNSAIQSMLKQVLEGARAELLDDKQPIARRVQSLDLTALDAEPRISDWASLLDARQPAELQRAALERLASCSRGEVPGSLVESWTRATPGIRNEILELLLSHESSHPKVIAAIEEKLIPASQISSSARTRLTQSANPNVRAKAAELLQAASANRRAVVESYRASLSIPPDIAAGQKVFARECATCHRLQGAGHEVGPNLATIAGRAPEQLLQNILDPSAEILPLFVEVSIVLEDGRVASGIIASENARSITLKRAEGVEQTIERESIESIQSTGKSLMPEGLEQKIGKEEMAHLIAYMLDATDTSKITGKR